MRYLPRNEKFSAVRKAADVAEQHNELARNTALLTGSMVLLQSATESDFQ